MQPRFPTDWINAVNWITAIGTLLAVIVAVLAPRIERWWRGNPNLTLNVEQVVVLPPDTEGKRMVILPIENTGTYFAERAEVFVRAVSWKSTSGSYEKYDAFVPLSLRWNHYESNQEIFVTIAPKMQRYCILGSLKPVVEGPNTRPQASTAYFELWTEYKRSKEANELSPGRYQIDLLLAANGMLPRLQKIWLEIPHEFEPEKMKISIHGEL